MTKLKILKDIIPQILLNCSIMYYITRGESINLQYDSGASGK